MSLKIAKVEVWAADIRNRPGMLARVLEALTNAGAQLEFIVARRVTDNTSRVFVAPLRSKKERSAAADVGMTQAKGLHTIRIEAPDRIGLAAEISRAVADAGVNIRGVSAATIGKKSVIYMGFATEEELKLGSRVAKKAASRR